MASHSDDVDDNDTMVTSLLGRITVPEGCWQAILGVNDQIICGMKLLCQAILEDPDFEPCDYEDVVDDCQCYLDYEVPGGCDADNETVSSAPVTPTWKLDDFGLTDISELSQTVLTVLYCLIIVLSGVGNLLVILVFLMKKRLQTLSNMFLVSLACSDMLMTIFCMPVNLLLVRRRTWDFGGFSETGCKLIPYMQTFAVTVNIFTLISIAAERFVAVLYPLKMKQMSTVTYGLISGSIMTCIWISAALFAIPNALWFEYKSLCNLLSRIPGFDTDTCIDTVPLIPEREYYPATCTIDSDHSGQYDIYRLSFLLVLFCLPCVINAILYASISTRLWSPRNIHNQHVSIEQLRMRTYKRVTLMLLTIQVLFIVCWAPTMFYETIYAFKVDNGTDKLSEETALNLRYYFQWLAMCNSCFNPIVYVFLHEKFRKSLRCIGGKSVRRSRRVVPLPVTRQINATMTSSTGGTTEEKVNQVTKTTVPTDMTSSTGTTEERVNQMTKTTITTDVTS